MEIPIPMFALNGGTNDCDMTNMLLLLLSEVSTGAVSLIGCPLVRWADAIDYINFCALLFSVRQFSWLLLIKYFSFGCQSLS